MSINTSHTNASVPPIVLRQACNSLTIDLWNSPVPPNFNYNATPESTTFLAQYFPQSKVDCPPLNTPIDSFRLALAACANDAAKNATQVDPKTNQCVSNSTIENTAADGCRRAAWECEWGTLDNSTHPSSTTNPFISPTSMSTLSTSATTPTASVTPGAANPGPAATSGVKQRKSGDKYGRVTPKSKHSARRTQRTGIPGPRRLLTAALATASALGRK